MPTGDYLEGLVCFVLVLGAALGGAALLVSRRLRELTGAVRVVALGVGATLGLLAIHLGPAILGILSRETVLIAAGAWLAGVALVRAAPDPATSPARDRASGQGRLTWALAGLGVGAIGVFALAFARDQAVLAPGSVDILNFHLPGVARWIQTGSIWQIDVFLPDTSPGHYPNHGDVILLAAVLPWSNDFLSHLAMYPFYVLTGVACYALARELGAPRPAAALSGCLVAAMPVVAIPALIHGFPDAVLLFSFAAGLLFLLRHHRNGRTSELVLAGLALGVAFGTKWYGVSSVAVVVAVWAGATLLAGRPARAVARQGSAIVGLIAGAGGIWMLRNWIESENPVYPVEVAPLGITIFDAPRDVVRELGGFTIAGYLDDPAVLGDYVLPQFRDALALPGLVAACALALTGALLVASRGRPGRGALTAAVICAAGLAVVYAVTPYTAGGPEGMPVLAGPNSRYLIPTLVIAAALAGWLGGRGRLGAIAFAALALLAIADGLRLASGGTLSGGKLEGGDWALAAGALAAGAALWLAVARARLGPRGRRVALATAATLLVAACVLGGNEVQERFNANRYRGIDATTDFIIDRAPSGQRVGLVGYWDDTFSPALPAFGPRLENEVEYVGMPDHDTLRPYGTEDEFAAAVRRGDYDYLIVGRGRPPAAHVPEERWAAAAGFTPVTRSHRYSLFAARPSAGA